MNYLDFPSKSSPGTVYRVQCGDDGKLTCNCRGWTNKRGTQARQCTHTKQYAAGRSVEERGEFVYLRGATTPSKLSVPVIQAEAPPPMLASAMVEPVIGPAFDARYASGWVLEAKLDGHRCIAVVKPEGISAWSRPRAGEAPKARDLPTHVLAALQTLPPGTYDGELCVPGGTSSDVVRRGAEIIFVLFDALEVCGVPLLGEPYQTRRDYLVGALRRLPTTQRAVSTVLPSPCRWAQVQALWEKGYEGAVLKQLDSRYQPGMRSPAWVKVKKQAAAELEIIGFESGRLGPCSKVLLRDAEGVETSVKTLNNQWLREFEARGGQYLGRRLVISFQERTGTGGYRHPMFDHLLDERP